MAQTHREREDKYDVPADFAVPDLTGTVSGATVERATISLRSTYFDTADDALRAFRVTLRRREGDADTGWHLKVPGTTARTEIRLPPSDGGVPAELADLVRGLTGGAELRPVVEIRIERELHLLVVDGRTLVEVADDHVSSSRDGLHVTEWREVEAELVDGREKTLTAVGKRLLKAGAAPSAHRSKLAHALGAGPDRAGAAELVGAYLDEQLEALGRGDVDLRRGIGSVHKTRVAVRRVRSVLRVCDRLLDADVAAFDAELSWYQDLLGAVRDREVLRARFAAALAQLPAELVLGPVAGDIDSALLGEQLRAAEALQLALDSERYAELLRAVRSWAQRPPLPAKVTKRDIERRAQKARRKARARLRDAVRTGHADDLHHARRAFKRSRYAAELTGADARIIKWHKQMQDVLGEHQDSVVAAETLRRLGARFGAGAERNGFTYGVLWQREQQRAEAARQAVRDLR